MDYLWRPPGSAWCGGGCWWCRRRVVGRLDAAPHGRRRTRHVLQHLVADQRSQRVHTDTGAVLRVLGTRDGIQETCAKIVTLSQNTLNLPYFYVLSVSLFAHFFCVSENARVATDCQFNPAQEFRLRVVFCSLWYCDSFIAKEACDSWLHIQL